MSNTKNYWHDEMMERAERAFSAKIAAGLNIPEEDLENLEWEVVSDHNKDGFIYGYFVNFSEDSDPEVLERLGAKNNTLYIDGSAFEEPDEYYDEEEYDWQFSSKSHFTDFFKILKDLESLAGLKIPQEQQFSLHVMLFMHTVSALEHLLYRAFLHEVTTSDALARKLIETDPTFSTRTFALSDIFKTSDTIEKIVSQHVKDIIFHQIHKIIPMYRDVLGFSFEDVNWLGSAVAKRHDCAHRAGYTKEGEPTLLSLQIVTDLIENCRRLAERIDRHLKNQEA